MYLSDKYAHAETDRSWTKQPGTVGLPYTGSRGYYPNTGSSVGHRQTGSTGDLLLGIVGGVAGCLSLLFFNPWQSAVDTIATRVRDALKT
jgi:hypothetical protein